MRFFVAGIPKPKGSIRAFARVRGGPPILTSTTKGLKAWQNTIAWEARRKEAVTLEGPVYVSLVFVLPFPKGASKRDRSEGFHHATRPDLDKLVRAVLDALTGICWVDDGQVSVIAASKERGDPSTVGVTVEVAAL